ncbi:hypothetical protein L249_8801 [Ophiocordyceps polyrhachis-furcata BCC 54312]|uniref:DUF4536 domain-containing protein n=1 Tax=Ophiocordyceps polyrhachis-furcata BCC 54312 TaxID=1330021 RepID=A0A367L1N9_9HYPO|nr:hypothetical protein L249_8801 [Ophiocordyceps polyrhachis-furcata BCC 54312]
MAGDKMPSLYALEKPQDVQQLVRQDRDDDCLSCRIVGKRHRLSSIPALLGLAAYGYLSGMSQLNRRRASIMQSKSVFGFRSRQMGVVGISIALTWMGLWRALR